MTRTRLLALAALLAAPLAADGQPPVPGGAAPNPAFSPYLNLLRNNNPTYLNYYGLVRPQQDFQQSLQGVQSQLATTQSQVQATQGAAAQQTTGHSVRFLSYGNYFLTVGRGGGGGTAGGGGVGGGGMTAPRPSGASGLGSGGGAGMPSLRR